MVKTQLRSQLSKLNFALGRNPAVERDEPPYPFIPDGYEGVMTITADFELAWAPRYTHSQANPLEYALQLARRERRNVTRLLALSDRYGVPITWATVGHLFLESCAAHEGHKHPEIPAVPHYLDGPYWNFSGTDWFEYDPCTSLAEDPEWYAPDLIDQILAARTKQEIGCHTFSHIDCRDHVCPPALLAAELAECRRLAAARGLELTTFVHPGHTVGNLQTLAEHGFTSYQTNDGNTLGFPHRHAEGLWELRRTMNIDHRPEWSPAYHAQRYKTIVDRAIRHGRVCNFWFHPSFAEVLVDEVLPELFEHVERQRHRLWVGTVGEYVAFLNARS